MQHLKEFLIRLQTFNLRITTQEFDVHEDFDKIERHRAEAYDITRETAYYDSFSYKSELRVLKDMALIDLLTLDNERLKLELNQVIKVATRFKELWKSWHENHNEWLPNYKDGYIFTLGLDRLFIVNGLRGSNTGIAVSSQFVEDLGDSIKIRERSLRELINDIEQQLAPTFPNGEKEITKLNSKIAPADETKVEDKDILHVSTFEPSLDQKAVTQLYDILKNYFSQEEHAQLEALLMKNESPHSPLLFRGQANQLADAFKQLYDERLIISRRMIDLENWVAAKFNYLDNQGQHRELSQGYLSGIMSENSRPCKSPILKIERKNDSFFILPVSRGKK